jgi:hypothetical protein
VADVLLSGLASKLHFIRVESAMKSVWKETVLASLFCAMPALSFAQSATQTDTQSVREAIRFEKAKDAAAARQARMEERQPSVPSEAGVAAERESASVPGVRVTDSGEKEAVRFERSKEAAAARQAKIEARQTGSTSGAADRRAPRK